MALTAADITCMPSIFKARKGGKRCELYRKHIRTPQLLHPSFLPASTCFSQVSTLFIPCNTRVEAQMSTTREEGSKLTLACCSLSHLFSGFVFSYRFLLPGLIEPSIMGYFPIRWLSLLMFNVSFFSWFCRLFLYTAIWVLTVQKLSSFMGSHWLNPTGISWGLSSPFKKLLPLLASLTVNLT